MKNVLLVLLALLALLAACGSDAGADLEPTVPSTVAVVIDPVPSVDGGRFRSAEVPQDLVADVLADARARAGTEAIEVVSAIEVVWNDGSLGCPDPATSYTQALVDGFQVVLRGPAAEYDYRTSGVDFFMVCDR